MDSISNDTRPITVAVIIPVYNGEAYLDECLQSVKDQRLPRELEFQENELRFFEIEVSIYDDASSDTTPDIIQKWKQNFDDYNAKTFNGKSTIRGFKFTIISGRNGSGTSKGVGFAKNRAIEQSTAEFLCFCDADDLMLSERIFRQHELTVRCVDAIIGSKFIRIPETSTRNYTQWANSLSQTQLLTQVFSSFGPTVIMPSWFCRRTTFERVPGGFEEVERGYPEDLVFFYKHLDLGGRVNRVDQPLLKYRFHFSGATFSVKEETIRNLRLHRLETTVLQGWPSFSIWNAGKLGRRFFRSLKIENQNKVESFYDVDSRKIEFGYYNLLPSTRKIPIRHVRNASRPLVICVKTELTFDVNGPFQTMLHSLNLVEGVDYVYFN